MRRTRWFDCWLAALAVVPMVFFGAPGVAAAGHGGATHSDAQDLPGLVAAVADAVQRVADLGADIQLKQEGVNKALVELADARDTLEAARRDVTTSEQELAAGALAIAAAQRKFDEYAASVYTNGPSSSLILAESPEEILHSAGTEQTLVLSFQQVKEQLEHAHAEQAVKTASARSTQDRAEEAARHAQRSQEAAVSALVDAQQQFSVQQAEVDRAVAERDTAQRRLDAARRTTVPESGPVASGHPAAQWDELAPGLPGPGAAWDTTLPMVPSANVTGDPIAIVNAVLQISSTSAQVTADMGRKFLTKLGILSPPAAVADPGITNGRIPRVYGQQASEFVIRRAMSQIGVPYSWGGGNAGGPSRGIDQGANIVGFDCSGLVLYAFAGVGMKLPHYSGSQYNMGRKIPSSQMRRGDLIFYGPNASQHEAMYLGNGMMLEAPYTGSQVKVSPVRTSGMTPYVTRLIEY
ncbi:NlpC/P60 family peptidoglycan endopeptidase RipA [soil metagenome]